MEIITKVELPAEVREHELVDVMVAGANAKALRVAPCLVNFDDEAALAEAKLILVGAIKRWVDAGSGAFSQQSAGSFSVSTDTRHRSGFNLWPSEVDALRDLCSSGGAGGAFMVDMTSTAGTDGLETRPDLWFQWVHPTPHGAP